MTLTTLLLMVPDQVASAATQPKPEKEVVSKHKNVREAVREILGTKPQVIGFGEIHPTGEIAYRSTKATFAEEVLPLLAARGIRILVVEHLLNDPKIEAELGKFYAKKVRISREQTPAILEYSNYSDRSDLIRLLSRSRDLGIRVYPGGMTIAEADQTTRVKGYEDNNELKARASWQNDRAMKNRITWLLRGNPKLRFAFFGGVDHNNSGSSSETPGGHLKNRLGKQYFEVDLFAVCEKEVINAVYGDKNWEKQVAPRAVVTIAKGNTRSIFFPCRN